MTQIPDGLIVVAKRDCPTCELVRSVLAEIEKGAALTVYTQDDPAFPEGIGGVIDDTALEHSYRLGIDIVPTLLRMEGGKEAARAIGWNREEWETVAGIGGLGAGLPENRPGCGSRTQDPGMGARLAVRFGNTGLTARQIEVPESTDAVTLCAERGWTDGLPVVPPTEVRVLEMLDGTTRLPGAVVGRIPPDLMECTVEKAAINAVMAGCKPEYFPVVLAAIEAALEPDFGLHGIICTTNAVAPVVMVNGPMGRAIGMNAKGNAMGQGNQANASIGRAMQLVIRNVGGGRPGEIDRAVFGNPGKYTFCFAEDEEDTRWDSFAVERGFAPDASTVTLFPGDGVNPIIDHMSRTPEDLARSFAGCIRAVYHPGQVTDCSVFLVVGPEHADVFHAAGWSKARLKERLLELTRVPVDEIVEGRSGLGAIKPDVLAECGGSISKFHTGSLNIIRAGGSAGKYSAIIAGLGSITINPITKEIRP